MVCDDPAVRTPGGRIASVVARATTALAKGDFHRARDLADLGLNEVPDAETGMALLCVRAAAELGMGRPGEALRSAGRALVLVPGETAEAHGLAGMASARLGQGCKAVAHFARATELEPGRAAWPAGLASSLLELDEIEAAARAATTALALDERNVEALLVMGRLALRLGRPDEAVTRLSLAASCAPERADVHTTLGVALSASGNFVAGLYEYEWRQRLPGWNPRPFDIPAWDGGPLAGKRLLLWTEQGLGDSIQFVRFVEAVERLGAQVIFHGEPKLVRLFRSCRGFHELWPHHAPRPQAHLHASIMSLAALLGGQAKGRGAAAPAIPYLHPEPRLEQLWRVRLAERSPHRPRIGLVWQGNPGFCDDGQRSLALAHMLPVLTNFVGRVDFFSLQKGFGRDQLHLLPQDVLVEDLGGQLDCGSDAFVDSVAVMMGLDLLVTTDTALAHLAGALGRPVWTLLAKVPDWRWGVSGMTTPWYPTMRLFRQTTAGDWPGVVAQVGRALHGWLDQWAGQDALVAP